MSFGNPLGWIGLLSLPVILALHLMKERRNRYMVSDLSLWSFLDLQARGIRPRRIPLTWLLLLDLLVGALFSLAWMQPRLELPLPIFRTRHLVIVLDVSSSMLAADGLSTRFEQARQEALRLLEDAGRGEVVTVVAFGRGPRRIGDSRQDELGELAARVQALQAGETGHALNDALALGQGGLEPGLAAEFHILTDGAFPSEDEQASGAPAAVLNGFPHRLRWRLFGGEAGNLAVLELNATPVGEGDYQVFTRIANYSQETTFTQAALIMDGKPVAQADLRLPPNSTVPQVWRVKGAPMVIQVSLQGGDGLAADDTATVGVQPGGQVRVALVAEEPGALQGAVEAAPNAELEVFSPQEYVNRSDGSGFDLTIFRGFLPEAWPSGQVLLVEPGEAAGASNGRFLAVSGRRDIPANASLQFPAPDPLLEGIDFGGVRWGRAWSLDEAPAGFTPLLMADDTPLALRGPSQSGAGRVIILLMELEKGNFPRHPAFPILIGNLIAGARSLELPTSLKTGEAVSLPDPGQVDALAISGPGQAQVRFQDEWPSAWDGTTQPGAYRIEMELPAGRRAEMVTGVNSGDETESDLRPRPWALTLGPELGSEATAREQQDQEEAQTLDLTLWLLAAALLVLLMEARWAWR